MDSHTSNISTNFNFPEDRFAVTITFLPLGKLTSAGYVPLKYAFRLLFEEDYRALCLDFR